MELILEELLKLKTSRVYIDANIFIYTMSVEVPPLIISHQFLLLIKKHLLIYRYQLT